MEYGTDEYWAAINNLMNVVVREGEAGHFTKKGLEESGTTFLFNIVKALEPFGVKLQVKIVPANCDEIIEELTDEEFDEYFAEIQEE